MNAFYRGPLPQKNWYDEPQHIDSDTTEIVKRAEPSLDQTRLALCTHEAAHAIALVRHGVVPAKMWAKNGKGECNVPGASKMRYIDNVRCLLSGAAADFKFFGKKPNPSDYDHTVSKQLAAIREQHNGKSWKKCLQDCWNEACQLVLDNEKAIRTLGKWLYEESELTGTHAEIIAGLCPPREASDRIHVRPYEGVVTAARSGAPEFTDPNDPLTQKLYGRAVAFWSEYHAR
jgi:hypothetical protein